MGIDDEWMGCGGFIGYGGAIWGLCRIGYRGLKGGDRGLAVERL